MIEPLKKYRGIVSVGFGAVKARFSGEVEILELDEPDHAKLKLMVQRPEVSPMRSAKCTSVMGPMASTNVHWTADVNVSGQLASLAARLMVPVSQKLASQFYDQVRKKIETENAAAS